MSGLLAVKIDITLVIPNLPKVLKKKLFLSEKRKNVKSHCGTVFLPICGTLSPNCGTPVKIKYSNCGRAVPQYIGVQNLADHQAWNNINSLNPSK